MSWPSHSPSWATKEATFSAAPHTLILMKAEHFPSICICWKGNYVALPAMQMPAGLPGEGPAARATAAPQHTARTLSLPGFLQTTFRVNIRPQEHEHSRACNCCDTRLAPCACLRAAVGTVASGGALHAACSGWHLLQTGVIRTRPRHHHSLRPALSPAASLPCMLTPPLPAAQQNHM